MKITVIKELVAAEQQIAACCCHQGEDAQQ